MYDFRGKFRGMKPASDFAARSSLHRVCDIKLLINSSIARLVD